MSEKNPKSKLGWARITAAIALSLVFLAILIPNTGRLVTNYRTTPPTSVIVAPPSHIMLLISLLIAPLVCIVWGARRFRPLEIIGWILLGGLVAAAAA